METRDGCLQHQIPEVPLAREFPRRLQMSPHPHVQRNPPGLGVHHQREERCLNAALYLEQLLSSYEDAGPVESFELVQ